MLASLLYCAVTPRGPWPEIVWKMGFSHRYVEKGGGEGLGKAAHFDKILVESLFLGRLISGRSKVFFGLAPLPLPNLCSEFNQACSPQSHENWTHWKKQKDEHVGVLMCPGISLCHHYIWEHKPAKPSCSPTILPNRTPFKKEGAQGGVLVQGNGGVKGGKLGF